MKSVANMQALFKPIKTKYHKSTNYQENKLRIYYFSFRIMTKLKQRVSKTNSIQKI